MVLHSIARVVGIKWSVRGQDFVTHLAVPSSVEPEHASGQNLVVVCVPSTTADCDLFNNNHRNKKVVGGNCNILVHYVDVNAPIPSSVVLLNSFK